MPSSLRDHIDGHYIASEVALYLAYRRKSIGITCFLLVEGWYDEHVYSQFVSKAHCEIMRCDGKRNLIKAIKYLERWIRRFNGCLGIIDADFDALKGTPIHPNLLLTDGHDLEVMILGTNALDDLLEEYLKGKNKRSVDKFKSLIRKRLFALGSKIGYFRMKLYACGIKDSRTLQSLTFCYLNHLNSNCELSLTDAISIVKAECSEFDESQISKRELEKLRRRYARHLCHGKDMIEILREIFPKMTEKHFGKKIYLKPHFDKQLRRTFDQPHFKKTQLYQQIKEWEANNQPYRVLKE